MTATNHLWREAAITVYFIDGIRSLEQDLSQALPKAPEHAKPLALQRIQQLDARARTTLGSAAQGLVRTMHYRIDRYPAIVFDGEVVVYGVTDLTTARTYYAQWQAGDKP